MTMQRLYVGDLAGFDWKGNWNGNLPRALTSEFPPVRSGSQRKEFDAWVSATGLRCEQTDFDAFVARVSKAQIQAFLGRCYDGDPSYSDPEKMLKWEGEAYLVEQLRRVRREVEALDDTAEYGLVSACW